MARTRPKAEPVKILPDAIPPEWRELVFGIPGYDPTKGADGCWFDPAAARFAIDFFAEMLVHIEGGVAGVAFTLEPWQAAVIANLFGWKRIDAKGRVVRRYRELFVYVPRKNGKTPLCAGIGLLVFFLDDEAGQQGFIAAKDREQAGLLFRQMEGMVKANRHLSRRCKTYGGNAAAGQSRSFVKPDRSFLKIISGDGGGKHGGNPHIVIVDELHEQDDRELLDALQTSMVSANRRQSLMIALTTADYDRESVCNEKYDYAIRVRNDPAEDRAFLPVIYEADPKADPYDPATWRVANPNLGVSVSEEELGRLATKAKHEPGFAVEFKRLHLNLRTRPVVKNAIDISRWDACSAAVDVTKLARKRCWAGMDFGWSNDYAALVLIFPGEDEVIDIVPHFWIPAESERDRRVMPTSGFVASGLLKVTAGNSTDVEAIYDTFRDTRRKYDLRRIAYDPQNARKQGQDLLAWGYKVMEFWQSKKNYTEPWKWLMANGLQEKKIRHGGHAIMRWMAGNTSVVVDGLEGVMPKKTKSAEKIDGICALCMALGAWITDPDRSKKTGPRPPMVM